MAGSKKVILAALVGNSAIAITKFARETDSDQTLLGSHEGEKILDHIHVEQNKTNELLSKTSKANGYPEKGFRKGNRSGQK